MLSSKLAVILAIVTASTVSHAGDSTWLLCKGIADQGAKAPFERRYVVANLLERRGAPEGDTRELAVTLIVGDRVSRGTIVGADFEAKPAPLTVKNVTAKQPVTFTGTGQLAAKSKTFTLKGKLDVMFGDAKPMMEPFVAKLTCETLDDLAIGH